MRSYLRACACALIVLTLSPQWVLGQTMPPSHQRGSAQKNRSQAKERWRATPLIHVTSEYSDNAFLLPESRKTDLATLSAAEQASGRYAGMTSAGGVTTIVGGGVSWRGPGLAGRTLEIRPDVALAADLRNDERRNVDIELVISQNLPHQSEARLTAQSTPSYFMKNYLVDATDANGDGMISTGERRYGAGRYRESDVSLDYRFRLNKSTSKSPFGAAMRVGAGYYARAYDAPFSGRDLSGPMAEARVLLDVTRRVAIAIIYDFRSLAAPAGQQVTIVDESDVGRDLNGNATTTDPNVRVFGVVDRSRTEHTAGLRATLELSKRSDVRIGLERRMRQFSSEQASDFAHNGRRDARNQVGAELTFALRSAVRLSFGVEHSAQQLRRGLEADLGEIDDYSRNRVALGLRFGR